MWRYFFLPFQVSLQGVTKRCQSKSLKKSGKYLCRRMHTATQQGMEGNPFAAQQQRGSGQLRLQCTLHQGRWNETPIPMSPDQLTSLMWKAEWCGVLYSKQVNHLETKAFTMKLILWIYKCGRRHEKQHQVLALSSSSKQEILLLKDEQLVFI